MSAYFNNGFCVRVPSWHRQETLLEEHPENWSHALELAGIDWEPEVVAVARKIGERPNGDPIWEEIPNERAVVKNTTKQHLGTVSHMWEPITHAAMGEFVEALLEEDNVKIDTMVELKDGRQVAASILLDEPYTINGDDSLTLPYLSALMAHGGSGSNKVLASQIRVVCANTAQAASLDGERTGRQFVFRHTAGVHDRIEEAKQALAGVREDAVRWQEIANALAILPAPEEKVVKFLSEFIPEPPADVVSDKVRENIAAARGSFRTLYEASITNAAHHGTALGLVNASIEYLDHLRGYNNQDTYLGRQLLRAEPLKAKAVKIVREVCHA